MSIVCCTRCRLRFAHAEAAYIVTCPECGKPPLTLGDRERSVGFALYVPEGVSQPWPEAIPVALPVFWPDEL